MNRILIFILLNILITPVLHAQDTIRIYYDSNWKELPGSEGAAFYRKAWTDGNNWIANDYFISHKIQMTGSYKTKKMNVKHGHFTYYHENGTKMSEGDYADDQYTGLWNAWFENGQLQWTGSYKENVPDGDWKYWHETGELKSEGKFLNKNKSGEWHHWYVSGKLECIETFSKNGNSTFQSYYENGAKKCQGSVVNNIPEGMWTYWNSDDRIFLKGKYERGLRSGEWERIFPNGEVMKLQFSFGVIEGREYEFGAIEINE